MLTLEQVLARSMQSQRRTGRAVIQPSQVLQNAELNAPMANLQNALNQKSKSTIEPSAKLHSSLAPRPAGINLHLQHAGILQNSYDLTSALKSARALGDWVTALSLFQSTLSSSALYRATVDHFQEVIRCLSQEEKLDYALQLLVEYPDLRFKTKEAPGVPNSKNQTRNRLFAEHDRPSFNTLFSSKQRVTEALDEDQGRDLYHRIMKGYLEQGLWERALSVAKAMEVRDLSPKELTYNLMITALDKGGHWQQCLDVFEKIKSDLTPNAVTYAAVISALENVHQYERAKELLSQAPKKDRDAILSSYAALIHVWSAHHKGHKSIRE